MSPFWIQRIHQAQHQLSPYHAFHGVKQPDQILTHSKQDGNNRITTLVMLPLPLRGTLSGPAALRQMSLAVHVAEWSE